jgi:hypothetical protein
MVNGDQAYETNLSVVVRDKDGNPRKAKDVMKLNWLDKLRFGNKFSIDLGSGMVTNVGVLALANDYNFAAPSGAAINTLKLANYHVSGTGATAAAATDIKLQTQSTANGGQTPVAGAQSLISAANLQKYQTVATIAYTGTEAVTEWGCFVVLSVAQFQALQARLSLLVQQLLVLSLERLSQPLLAPYRANSKLSSRTLVTLHLTGVWLLPTRLQSLPYLLGTRFLTVLQLV